VNREARGWLRDIVARSLRPPLRDWRFWLIQTFVILIAAGYWAAVFSGRWQLSVFWAGELLALFLLPVVYAALNFGLAGAMATAVWASVLSLPSVPLAASAERASSIVVGVAVFVAVATFVGDRVERETILRREKDAYAAHVVRAQEEERARIAQELHDEPLQTVVHLYRLLDRLSTAPANGPADDVRHGLDEARGVAERIAGELRRLARGLRPASLEDLGLVTALERLVEESEAHAALSARLEVKGQPRRLDPLVELGLFRIAQEGLRNVERHARASRVQVGLRFQAAAVVLTVEDDGRGLPATAAADGELRGLGLIGMEERAALLGGRFELGSQPALGTRLVATIPTRHQ
jgi:two-component system NarL family sensor kinase